MSRLRFDFVVGPLVLLALLGCTSDDGQASGGDEETGGGAQVEYVLCTEPAGSWIDTSDEDSDWRLNSRTISWIDPSGCAVRLDHLWHTFGDEHCDWERVEHISFGLPMGTPYTGPDATPPGQDWAPLFIFNTDGAVDDLPPGEVISAFDIPETAISTGLKTVTGHALVMAGDESVLYDIQGDTARLFVRISEDDYGCA